MITISLFYYEYIDDCEKFNEAPLPDKENFYSHLNLADITDADYAHVKRVSKDFEIKNLGEYNDLYVQSDALLLAGVFEKVVQQNSFQLQDKHGKQL